MKSLPNEEYQAKSQPRRTLYSAILANGALETAANAVSLPRRWRTSPSDSSSRLAVQLGQASSHAGSNMTCCMMSCLLGPNKSSRLAVPSGPVKT